MENIDA